MAKKKVMSRGEVARKARQGEDLGNPGKGFDAGVNKLKSKVGKKIAERIMGAQMEKMRKRGQL